MNLSKTIGHVILGYIGSVVFVDLVGVLLVTILPEPDSYRLNGSAGFGSVALYYTVWLVGGIFAGGFYTVYSLDITKDNTGMKQKPVLIFIIALLLTAVLILIFYALGEMQNPRYNYSNNYYVPGHRNVTFCFFITFLLMTILLLQPEKKKQKP